MTNEHIGAIHGKLFGPKIEPLALPPTKVIYQDRVINNHLVKELVGPKGNQGDVGVAGPKGDIGEQGIQGPKGDMGVRGNKGEKGDIGEQGIQGPKGDKGVKGEKGDIGEQGIPGPIAEISEEHLASIVSKADERIQKGFWSLGGSERYRVLNATTVNPGAIPLVQTSKLRVASFKQLVAGSNITLTQDAKDATITVAASGGGGSGGLNSFTSPDGTITIGGTLTDPTVDVTTNLYVPYTGATTNVDLGSNAFNAGSITINGGEGSGDSLDVAGSVQADYYNVSTFGRISDNNGNLLGHTLNLNSATVNSIAGFDGSSNLVSLSTATYPSLTELSYVKGVTSSIQTQFAGKQATITLTTTGTSGAATFSGGTLNIPQYAGTTYSAGTGLTLTGSTFSITNTAVTAASYGSATSTPTYTVNPQGQLTAASSTNIQYISVGASITAAGTNQATATALASTVTPALFDVTTVASGTGVNLPTASTSRGAVTIVNRGANPLLVYSSSASQSINGLSTTAAYTIPVNSAVQFLSTSGTTWFSNPSFQNGDVNTTDNSAKLTISAIQGTVVSGTTGSGSVVFSTSPTLVTPALGTPSSAVLTNATGTASGLTAGTVATISGLITAGTNVTITGSGTSGSPYSISSTGAGGGVTSISGDGTIISNLLSTGVVTLTLANTPTGTGGVVLASAPTMSNPIVGTQAATDNSTKAASTAYVQTALLSSLFGQNIVVPVLANFTLVNNSSNITQTAPGGICIQQVAVNGNNLRMAMIAAPGTPYRAVGLLLPRLRGAISASLSNIGLVFRNTTTGQVQLITLAMENSGAAEILVASYSNNTTFNTTYGSVFYSASPPAFLWFACADDGTTVYFEYSLDGINWVVLYSIAKASGYLGATGYNQVGVFGNFNNSSGGLLEAVTLASWQVFSAAP